ncbi:MAG: lipopolysaccharide biosynthesis protein [Lachnospira sp.]
MAQEVILLHDRYKKMKTDRTRNVSRNFTWGMFQRIVSSLFPFITRTVMIYTIGLSYVGLSGLFSSVLMVLNLAELGIGNAMVYFMYKPMAEENVDEVCALLAVYRKCYRVIGLVILGVGICLFPLLHFLVNGEVPSDINLEMLFAVYLLNNVLGYFLFAYRRSLLIAAQRSDYLSKVGTLIQIFSSLMMILALLMTRNYYLYILVMPLSTIVSNLLVAVLTWKLYPHYQCKGRIPVSEQKKLKKMVSGLMMQKIGGIVNESVDTIVISGFLGLVTLALYQNYFVVISTVMGFVSMLNSSLTPSIGNSIASETVEDNYRLFNNLNFIYIWIVSWSSICMLCMFQPFIRLWLGEECQFGMEMVLLFVAYYFVYRWCDVIGLFQEACGLWWETRLIPITGAVLNLVVNIALVKTIGLPGILISTILSILFVYDLGSSRALFNTYFKSIRGGFGKYWRRQIFYLIIALVTGISTWLVCSSVECSSVFWQLCFNGCVCLLVPNLLLLIFWGKCPEMKYARLKLKQVMRL